jgi:hypothetical protein
MALGASGALMTCRTNQAALVTLPFRKQRVQTRIFFVAPFTMARTVCRLGSNRRGPTLCA